MTNIAISYARFSSARQSEGDSLRRQIENAEKYAAENGLVIDRSLSFTDLGVSAYDNSNIEKGALGLFLRAVQDGKVPTGATLIIESFDRLSRATPMDAFGVFTSILNAGLNLVTLTIPPRLFNRASVQADMFQLLEALFHMHRANAESARKSELVGAAWKAKKLKAQNGELMSGRAPHWIRTTVDPNLPKGDPKKRQAALIPERAKIVLSIIEMAEKGIGNTTILQMLNSNGIPAFSKAGSWQQSYIQKMLTSPALYGAITLDDEIKENYYPSIITRERFALLQQLRSARATTKTTNRKGKSVTNLFSGLLKCGYCGGAMNVGGYKKRATGYERKYVGCHNARTATLKCIWSAWFMDELEDTLLFWLIQVDYSKIVRPTARTDLDTQRELLAAYESKRDTLQKNVENSYRAIEEGLTGMVPRVKKLESEVQHVEKLFAEQSRKIEAMTLLEHGGRTRMTDLVRLFKMLKKTTNEAELRSLREQLSAVINLVVQQIQLYPTGHNPRKKSVGPRLDDEKSERFIDVLFKNGAQRRIEPSEC